ncbi:pyridoxal phosphate-dependent aminotransferase [Allobaculum mucilyticum]|uniref:pyridoxal phosphate-dependent aminotransferase n=1 Tax=Allobaculum mucilyticum TaxID=2834459 RepID=UPI001E505990|nr:aminotransferase class I/II-fold pyridoxal phosphate-dependent enzyme [Allobaculum mucilyticum]UNT95689.1 aminotransferase class I/II-fold pyridoxal phosphate-dependent enzyme [Allobaculum mucilyticum]
MELAQRMKDLHTSVFTDLSHDKAEVEAQTGMKVLDFSLGSPDIPPAPAVIETLSTEALNPANYRYAVSGLPQLIEAVQNWYKTSYDVTLEADQICLLQGSQEALVNLPLLYLNPDDGFLIPDPYYPAYYDAPKMAQGEVLLMPLLEENDYLIDFDAISEEDRRKAKMMLVNYPNNPTGACAPDEFIMRLIDFARRNDILVIYDNAYSELIFNGEKPKSFLSFPGASEVGIELNSFSKSYGMAGARLGIMAGNRNVIEAYKDLKSNMDYGIFLPVQYAGVTALHTGHAVVEQTRQTYETRRRLILSEFSNAGWDLNLPDGTMFIWARIPDEWEDSYSFARDLLHETGILVTPGLAFGEQGRRYVRLALVVSSYTIRAAARRLQDSRFFLSLHS